jgi:hypothetical protein
MWMNIRSRKFKRVIVILSIAFVLFQIIYFFIGEPKGLDTIPIGIQTILILIFSFYFFYEQLKESVTPIYDHFFFWITIGLIIYLAGSFFMYILAEDLNKINRKQLLEYWFITYVVDIIKNFFFFISALVFLKQSKSVVRKTVLPNLDFY